MKRWGIRIFVFLPLGVIVNVAVAWACALWSAGSLEDFRELPMDAEARSWWARAFPTAGPSAVQDETLVQGEARWFGLRARMGSSGHFVRLAQSILAGWPMAALSGERKSEQGQDFEPTGLYPMPVGRTIGWFGPEIPLRPIWPGFAINTVFYAAILWGLFAAPFALRRWRRIKHGLCPKCGYDLRGSPDVGICPECGWSEAFAR